VPRCSDSKAATIGSVCVGGEKYPASRITLERTAPTPTGFAEIRRLCLSLVSQRKLSAGEQLTDKLAEKAGVGRSTVYDAKKLLREGTPEEIKELESGKAKAKPLAEKIRRREKQSFFMPLSRACRH
jgi:hypothetical protein